jgi:hypothetical protein
MRRRRVQPALTGPGRAARARVRGLARRPRAALITEEEQARWWSATNLIPFARRLLSLANQDMEGHREPARRAGSARGRHRSSSSSAPVGEVPIGPPSRPHLSPGDWEEWGHVEDAYPFPEQTIRWVLEAVGLGGRIASVRPLRRGTWHANHAVDVLDQHGRLHRLTLRRWARPGWEVDDPDFTADREAKILELLAATPVPAPRLVAADPTGAS